jgi:K+-sensing histidine kinase KdpD
MFLDHVIQEDRNEVDTKYRYALSTQTAWDFECRIHWADGTIRWIWAHGNPSKYDDKNEVLTMTGIVRDITERKETEVKTMELEALKIISQGKSDLLANVSHELRTPLASIKGNIESLIEPDVKWSKKQQLEFLQSANNEADRLTFLIRDLLDMSRIDSGKMELDKRSYLVSEIFDSASRVLSVITAKHKLKIIIAPLLSPVQADKVRIGQVITNLVENATKIFSRKQPNPD